MALILSLETSGNTCSVALHRNYQLISWQTHHVEKSHSSLLLGAVEEVLRETHLSYKNLDAVAVSEGPGSYTGLRIGVTTAKGICYSLSVPLIAIETTDILIEAIKNKIKETRYYLCPMLDARRMEVYTKMVDYEGNEIWSIQAKIIHHDLLKKFLWPVYLFGSGMPKFRDISTQKNLVFINDIYPNACQMGSLAEIKYKASAFESVAYFEPKYLKEWQNITARPKLL